MLLKLYRYVNGYVKVRIQGGSPERFLNLCINHDIYIWNLKNIDNDYEFNISIKGVKRLRPILKKTRTRLKIIEKCGLPFFLFRYRKRKLFFLGVVICFLMINTLSSYIWDIQFDGNVANTDDVLMDYLKDQNISQGILKKKINCEDIESSIREKFAGVIWTSAQIKGTRLIIYIKEGKYPVQKNEEKSETSSICASKNAVITKIVTRKGVVLVKAGDNVLKDMLLVDGKIPILNDSLEVCKYIYCNADADIYGQTIYTYNKKFPMKYKKTEYTDKYIKKYRFSILDKSLEFSFSNKKFEHFICTSEKKKLKLGENFYLPLTVEKSLITKTKIVDKIYTKEEAKNKAKKELDIFCENLKENGMQIVSNNVKIEFDNNYCSAVGNIELIENIVKKTDTQIINLENEGEIKDEYN